MDGTVILVSCAVIVLQRSQTASTAGSRTLELQAGSLQICELTYLSIYLPICELTRSLTEFCSKLLHSQHAMQAVRVAGHTCRPLDQAYRN